MVSGESLLNVIQAKQDVEIDGKMVPQTLERMVESP
jgi:hypothetical protein